MHRCQKCRTNHFLRKTCQQSAFKIAKTEAFMDEIKVEFRCEEEQSIPATLLDGYVDIYQLAFVSSVPCVLTITRRIKV